MNSSVLIFVLVRIDTAAFKRKFESHKIPVKSLYSGLRQQ